MQRMKEYRMTLHSTKAFIPTTHRTIHPYRTTQQTVKVFNTQTKTFHSSKQQSKYPHINAQDRVRQHITKQRARKHITSQNNVKSYRASKQILNSYRTTTQQTITIYRTQPHTPPPPSGSCSWDSWGSWSGGSKTCGTVIKSRNRDCVCSDGLAHSILHIELPKGTINTLSQQIVVFARYFLVLTPFLSLTFQ